MATEVEQPENCFNAAYHPLNRETRLNDVLDLDMEVQNPCNVFS